MKSPLRVRPEAARDIEEAASWYEQQRYGLGHEFLDEVLKTYTRIVDQPVLFPTVHRKTRRALIHRFPFGVYYRAEEFFIVVIAVWHGRRNPQHWKRRL